MQYHQLANLFPLIQGSDFDELKKDIKENGQLEPVWIYEGQILDGRNRYRACKDLGINQYTKEYQGDDPLKFVLSLNLHRRHLDAGQRAVLALEILPMFEARAKERIIEAAKSTSSNQYKKVQAVAILPQPASEPPKPKAREEAASLVGVGERYIQDAKKIQKEAPELIEEIKSGSLSLPEAKKAAQLEPDKRVRAIEMVKSGEVKNVDKAKTKIKAKEKQERQKVEISQQVHKPKVNLFVASADNCPLIPDNIIDLIITSPPYNLGADFWPMGGDGRKSRDDGIGYDDNMPYPEYFDWQIRVFKEMYRVAKDGASFFYNHKVRQKNGGIVHPVSWLLRPDNPWTLRQEIIWDRKSTHNHTASLFWQHDERIYWMTKGQPDIPNQPIGTSTIWKEFGPVPNQKEHPAPFTEKLPQMLIKPFLQDGIKVLDPFIGSGTVIDVCYKAGIESYGIDISYNYISAIKERYNV